MNRLFRGNANSVIFSINARAPIVKSMFIGNGGILIATNCNLILHHVIRDKKTSLWEVSFNNPVTQAEIIFENELELGLAYIGTITGKIYVIHLNR